MIDSKMSMKGIEIEKAFGVEKGSKWAICFKGDNHLLYLAGSNLIEIDLHSLKSQIHPIKTRGTIEFMSALVDQGYIITIDMDKRSTYISTLMTTNYKTKRHSFINL